MSSLSRIPQTVDNIGELIRQLNELLDDIEFYLLESRSLVGQQTFYGDVDMQGHRIVNLSEPPSEPRDAVTLTYFQNNPAGQFASPVSIGTSNQEGSAETINRSDHVHAHASGLGVDLHHNQNHAARHASGGADPLDHGTLAGLGDDDHTIYIKSDGTRAFTGDQSMGSHKLTDVTDPTAAQDAATKAYVDTQVVTDHSALSNLNWAAAGHTIDADVNFAGFMAQALVCDNGSTLPTTPGTGQWFLHTPTGRNILYMYDGSNWIPMISLGSMTIYVDGTNGSDDLNKGSGTGTSAFKTIQYAVDAIPGLVGGDVTINIASGTYSENVTIQGKSFTGNYSITLNGTLSQQESATADSVSTGVAGTQGTLTDTGAFLGDSYANYLVYLAGNSNYRVIDSHTDDVLTIVGTFSSSPANLSYTVYGWGTVLSGFLAVKNQQVAVTVNDLKVSNTLPTGVYLEVGAECTFNRCYLDANISLSQYSAISLSICYSVGNTGAIQAMSILRNSYLELNRSKAQSESTSREIVFLNQCSVAKLTGGAILDTGDQGLWALGGSSADFASPTPNGFCRVRNCTTGLLAQAAFILGTTNNQYSGNTTDEDPAAASDPAYID